MILLFALPFLLAAFPTLAAEKAPPSQAEILAQCQISAKSPHVCLDRVLHQSEADLSHAIDALNTKIDNKFHGSLHSSLVIGPLSDAVSTFTTYRDDECAFLQTLPAAPLHQSQACLSQLNFRRAVQLHEAMP